MGSQKAHNYLEIFRRLWLEQDPSPAVERVPLLDNAVDEMHGAPGCWIMESSAGAAVPSKLLCFASGLVAVEKPSGMSTEEVQGHWSSHMQLPLSTVSRLDQPTSGILPMALGNEFKASAHWLRAQFAARLVSKEYICLCKLHTVNTASLCVGAKGEVSTSLKVSSICGSKHVTTSSHGLSSLTRWEVLALYRAPAEEESKLARGLALMRVHPRTGRTHQIRVHLASTGMPLAGDAKYGCISHGEVHWCPRLFLHCHKLQLLSLDARRLSIQSELMPELSEVLDRLAVT